MSNISYKHFIYDHELMLYPYAPIGLLHNNGEWPTAKYKLCIVAAISAEDSNIIRWITYHQALGIDHIYLYCTDKDPTELYRQLFPFTLGEKPFITFHHFHFTKFKTQIYFHFIRNYLHETIWYINLDSVNYLYINEKQTLSNFIDQFQDSNIHAIYFNIVPCNKKEDSLFTIAPINYSCIYTKLMIRSQFCPYQYIFQNLDKVIDHHIHHDELIKHSYNVLHQNMSEYYANFPHSAIEFMDINTQNEVIATAYITHIGDDYDAKINIDNLSLLYTNSLAEPEYNDYYPPIRLDYNTPDIYWRKLSKTVWKSSFLPAPLPLLSVVSDGKNCKQSSLPDNVPNNLANNVINGHLKGTTQTISKKESSPWWEIDLEKNYIIKNIRLFNGIDLNIQNMTVFTIETSEDYSSWIQRFQKVTTNIFGGVDGSYYNWIHPLGIKARWIRITVPGENKIFSLDQIQILGIEQNKFYIS